MQPLEVALVSDSKRGKVPESFAIAQRFVTRFPPVLSHCRSEAFLADFLDNHRLDALNVFQLLAFHVSPQLLQIRLAIGIGDVLIVSPQSIEPLAQVVDEIVIVIFASTSLTDVLQFLLGC
jgi:hypothetical protein